jgi:hypothetical protein
MSGSIVLGDLDVVGDDDESEEIDGDLTTMGAARRRFRGRRRVRVPVPAWMRATTSQGVSRPKEELDFLPFEPVELIETRLTGFLIARPQRPFRGERLVMSVAGFPPAPGVNAADFVVIDPAIYVGAVQVGASQGGTPVSTFGATAFGVRLSMPPAGQGTDIKIFVRALVPPGEEGRLVVAATMLGRAMR